MVWHLNGVLIQFYVAVWIDMTGDMIKTGFLRTFQNRQKWPISAMPEKVGTFFLGLNTNYNLLFTSSALNLTNYRTKTHIHATQLYDKVLRLEKSLWRISVKSTRFILNELQFLTFEDPDECLLGSGSDRFRLFL